MKVRKENTREIQLKNICKEKKKKTINDHSDDTKLSRRLRRACFVSVMFDVK